MKILWITNTPLGALGKKILDKEPNGLWMGALLDDLVVHMKYEIVVATTVTTKETIRIVEKNIVYYGIPDQVPLLYNENKPENILAWKTMLEKEKPDLIQVWGTEFTHGLCALRAAQNIPAVIYMQGYLRSIARHYFAGIPHKELRSTITFRDLIKKDSIERQQKKYERSTEKEKEMIQLAGTIICENNWCEDSIKSIAPNTKVYRCPLSVNQTFWEKKWSIEKAEKHSIICTASGYPLKGLHMVLRAVALLAQEYPDIKLYVPGTKMVADGTLQWLVRKRGYTMYVEKLIRELKIEKHIVWLGQMTQEELAEQYAKTNVFVLSSSIENHSSSLKEAMMVGVPSVAAAVGGVPEYVRHGENGFLYRFEEYEIMARYIDQLFRDDDLSNRISASGRVDMKSLHEGNDILGRMIEIYNEMLGEEKECTHLL